MKVRDLLSDESKWTKGVFHTTHADGDAFCLAGAISQCYVAPRWELVRNAVMAEINGCITLWNDAPERTFADVKALVDRLDI